MSINASPDPDYVAAHTGVVIDPIIDSLVGMLEGTHVH